MVISWHFPFFDSTGKQGAFLQLNLNLFLLLINICFSHYNHALYCDWSSFRLLHGTLLCSLVLLSHAASVARILCSITWGLECANLELPASITTLDREGDLQPQWLSIFVDTLYGRSEPFVFFICLCWLICFKHSARLVQKSLVAGWKGMPVLCENRAVQIWCHM